MTLTGGIAAVTQACRKDTIIGDPADDPLVLLGRLIAKIRRALSVKHLVDGESGLQIGANRVVRGMVESDRDYDGRTPLLIIDGRVVVQFVPPPAKA